MLKKASRIRNRQTGSLFLDGLCLSRKAAIQHVRNCMNSASIMDEATIRLVELFNLDPEELSEAGLAYEQLRALLSKTIHACH